ncbi:unnamed protein product [Gordionus sp. m RMFG-2023]
MSRNLRNQSQPAPIIQHQEFTPNNSLDGPASDPTIAAIVSAMQAISTQMAELTRESNERRQRSPSLTSTPHRTGRAPTPPPPPPTTVPAPVIPAIPLTPLEKYEKMRKVWAGLQQDLIEPKCKASIRDRDFKTISM